MGRYEFVFELDIKRANHVLQEKAIWAVVLKQKLILLELMKKIGLFSKTFCEKVLERDFSIGAQK